ncbi:hypothetical protein SO802_003787 [Lithocarpus litseifolius]|uniref:Uncharacterized protein n=1 Tax=Lithocarpus litseifolius TaxID=425828 RepID=A0AAW2E4Z5_9ROSI
MAIMVQLANFRSQLLLSVQLLLWERTERRFGRSGRELNQHIGLAYWNSGHGTHDQCTKLNLYYDIVTQIDKRNIEPQALAAKIKEQYHHCHD